MAKGDNNNNNSSGGCVTRQVVTQRCAPEEVEPGTGRHVYRCEKKIQTFRDCYGRPSEVINSQTEITEHEMDSNLNYNVQYSMTQSSSSSSSLNWDTDVQYDATEEDGRMIMEEIERMDKFIEGVEKMTEGIMSGVERIAEGARSIADLFGFPSFPGDVVKEEEREVDETDEHVMKEQDQVYSEYADKIRDV